MSSRYEELDGLRGLLSVIVVVGHLYVWLVPWFWGCMEVFFCLSAFLIGSIIFGNIGKFGFLTTYFTRRTLRIWPLYYVVLGFCLLFQTVLTHAMSLAWRPGSGVVQSLFFAQNVELLLLPGEDFTTQRPGYPVGFDHSWSLALEEQFYIIALLVGFLCTRLSLRNALLALATLPVISLIARVYGFNIWLLPARFDAFAGGLMVALLWHHRNTEAGCERAVKMLGRYGLPVSGALVAGLFLFMGHEYEGDIYGPVMTYGISLFALLSVCLVSFLITRRGNSMSRFFRWAPMCFLGKISYSTYLWHLPVIWYITICSTRIPSLEAMPQWVVMLPTIFGVSYASYLTIERPFLRMREMRKHAPSTRGVEGVTTGASAIVN